MTLRTSVTRSALAVILLVLPLPAAAQDQGNEGAVRIVIDGSPPPVHPESITRDSLGRATVRAIRLTAPLVLDGRLDEEVYSAYQPFGGFVQAAPTPGAPSTERTDAWVLYDDEYVYVACRCWDSAPPEQWIVNELRRDTNGLRQNDHFGVMFDTFYDRRSGFLFYANPLGARADYNVVDEGGSNTDWNPVWDARSARFEGGWSIELAIPFKSLRYISGPDQVWGIQLRRSIRRKNEWLYLNPVPAFLGGPQAFNRISMGGTVVDLDLPPASRNIEIKPYGVGGLTTDRLVTPERTNDGEGNVGFDLKYGLTANLTADFTLNTDFAQVEVDEQQVNLTRFNLSFPEKREFFLEGRGIFGFGGAGGAGGPGQGGGDTPALFYTRRIGLDSARAIAIHAGGRVTGKVGPYTLGLMNIQTGDEPLVSIEDTNFSIVRVKRDVLRRSSVGAMFTHRSVVPGLGVSNSAYGVDAAFAFFTNLQGDVYYARTSTSGLSGNDDSYRASVSYAGDRYGFSGERLVVGDAFRPEVGFARRLNFQKWAGSLRFSPRPTSIPAIRRLTWEVNTDYFEDGAGDMESREQGARFAVEFSSSDQLTLQYTQSFERLDRPFRVGPGVSVAPGRHGFGSARASYQFGTQRRASGTLSLQHGDFYDGTLTSVGLSGGRVVVSNHLSLEPGVTVNRIDLPAGNVKQNLLRSRLDYAFTSRMFASALVQYSTGDHVFSSNMRFRWEYRPGSEVFLVWTDERNTGAGGTGLRNRALALKITRLFRF